MDSLPHRCAPSYLDAGSASRLARRRASHGGRADEMREKAQSVLISMLICPSPAWRLALAQRRCSEPPAVMALGLRRRNEHRSEHRL